MSEPKDKSPEYEAAEALFGLRPNRRSAAVEAAPTEPIAARTTSTGPEGAGAVDDRLARAPAMEILVLRDEVGAPAVLALADAEGWQLREETSRAHLVLASRRWVTTSGETVTYLIDHPGGAQSLRVEGTWAAALAKRLREWLQCQPEAELLDVVLAPAGAGGPDPIDCVRAASKLAAIRPEQLDARHMAALERLLSHPVDAVRRAGIRSAYGCRWPELRAVVERRRADEQRLAAQLDELRRYLDGDGDGR